MPKSLIITGIVIACLAIGLVIGLCLGDIEKRLLREEIQRLRIENEDMAAHWTDDGETLEKKLEKAQKELDELKKRVQTRGHNPTIKGTVDDLDVPLDEILRGLPDVAEVSVPVSPGKPTHRIVHLKDWHFVPKKLFAADLRDLSEEPITDEEIDRRYEDFLSEVETVQREQRTILRCLIQHHGLREVFCEGLTEQDVPIFEAQIEVLRNVEKQLPELRKQYAEATKTLGDLEEGSDAHQTTVELKENLESLLHRYRCDRLRIREAGHLYMDGEVKILPVEDREAWENANPLKGDGAVILDEEAIEARQDAQVKKMLDHGPLALVILGGGHDLSDNIKRLPNDCQYIVVTTKSHRRFSGGAERACERGDMFASRGQFDKAIFCYNSAIGTDPKFGNPYRGRGIAHAKTGDFDKALEDFNRAIELNPKDAESFYNRGLIFYETDELDKAINDYSRAIELRPDSARAFNNRGNTYRKQEQFEKALADFSKAIQLDESAKHYRNRGTALAQQGKLDEAIADFTKAIELDPQCVDAYCDRAAALAMKREAEKAIKDLNEAIRIDPKKGDAYFLRSMVHKGLGHEDEAKADLEKAKELRQDSE